MKRGFTLVELSIVLVVIGLLIGGILVGQSLIGSAKVNRMVQNLQQYEIAIQGFINKYKQLPGDSNRAVPPGNNDRRIDPHTGNCNGSYGIDEMQQMWYHLSSMGMLNVKLVAYSPTNCSGPHEIFWAKGAGKYIPVFATVGAYSRDYLGQGFDTDKVAIIYYQDYFSTYALFLDGLAIDKKMDDGDSNGGAMMFGDDIDGSQCETVAANNPSKLNQIICEFNYSKKFVF